MALRGELDMATIDIFTDAVTRCERDGSTALMLDLRDLTFMDATGLRAFLQARDRSLGNGHRLLFVGASIPVRKVFEVTGTESVLEEHEAVTTLDQFTRDGHGAEGLSKEGDPHG
jgi:anti-anti-sigma factor